MTTTHTVRCINCGVKIKAPTTVRQFQCPKCQTNNVVGSFAAPQQPLHVNGVDRAQTISTPPASVSFYRYLQSHFAATHGLWVGWAMLAIAVAMPLLSVLKPVIGLLGMIAVVVILGIMSLMLGTMYILQQVWAFHVRQTRTAASRPTSWLARLSYGTVVIACFLACLTAAERFTSEQGLLVAIIPDARAMQTRIVSRVLAFQIDPHVSDAFQDPQSPGKGKLGNDTDSRNASISTVVESTEEGSQRTHSSNATTPTPGNESVSQETARQVQSNSNEPSAKQLATAFREDQEGETPATPSASARATAPIIGTRDSATRSPPINPLAGVAQAPGRTPPTKSTPQQTVVVAEGVGTTRTDALKDAFRAAVRQVVGAIVDSETLIKDDELISDKVITHSDGIIGSGYEELSEKQEGGLFRIRIKAKVQPGAISERLRAANVTVRSFDGKALFAEAVTKLESQGSALELLAEAFSAFPSGVLEADINTKPAFSKGTGGKVSMTYQLTVKGEVAKYDKWQKKVVPLLEKLAVNKGEKFIVARPREELERGSPLHLEYMFHSLRERDAMEAILNDPQQRAAIEKPFMSLGDDNPYVFYTDHHRPEKCKTICVNVGRDATSARTHWKWYDIQVDWKMYRPAIEVLFLDSNGEEVTRDLVEFGKNMMPGLTFTSLDGIIVSPGIFVDHFRCYTPAIALPRSIDLQTDELAHIAITKCVVKQGSELRDR